MAPRRSGTIAVMIDLDWPVEHHHGIFAGIRRYADEHPRWRFALDPYADLTMKAQGNTQPYAGVIARPTKELAAAARRHKIPVVNVSAGLNVRCDAQVTPDPVPAGRMAVRHLIERGHRNLVGVATRDRLQVQVIEAAREEARGAGLALDVHVIAAHYNRQPGTYWSFLQDATKWIAEWPRQVGVFATSDLLARYLANICVQQGRHVPDNVSLIGMGNNAVYCEGSTPGLSSVDLRYPDVGYRAAQLVSALMRGGKPPAGIVVVDPGEVVVRRSSDVYAVGDAKVADAMQFIAGHHHESIRVREIVEHLPVSLRSLERRFQSTLGRSIMDELVRVRVEHARRLLLTTDMLVKEVAAATGFGTARQLSRAFKQREGLTPGELRRRG
jgi:LacI family transcriptional regulator